MTHILLTDEWVNKNIVYLQSGILAAAKRTNEL